MAFLPWWKLRILERKLYQGAFGKYNRYRCWCLKRNAQTTEEKLGIAREVLNGPGVNTMEAQYNELFVRQHEGQKRVVPPPSVVGEPPSAQPERRKQA
jgi:hypothetical protein